MRSSFRGPVAKAVALGTTCIMLIVFGIASIATADPGNGNDPHATDSSQTPSGSNGVNHNDTPEPANPDCTNSPGTSGTCSSPQPPSNADQNNTGANDTTSSNNYTSTRNGADSDNGSDNGNHTGEPCAGCVGKADNKNPHGQAPDGPTDHNNGYECDGNNGIGQTNPAHTLCTGEGFQSTTGSECVPDSSDTSNECAENNDHRNNSSSTNNGVDTFAGISGTLPGGVLGETLIAGATTPEGGSVLAGFAEAATPEASNAAVSAEVASPLVGGALPRTGVDAAAFLVMGLALATAGALLVLVNRGRVHGVLS